MRDEGSGFGEGRLGGGLVVGGGGLEGGGLEGDGGLYLPLMAVGMKGGGGSPSVEVEEGVEEQGQRWKKRLTPSVLIFSSCANFFGFAYLFA